MQTEAAEVFDLNREPKGIRNLYGNTIIGRQLLYTRRLIERGSLRASLEQGRASPGTITKASKASTANLRGSGTSRSPRF